MYYMMRGRAGDNWRTDTWIAGIFEGWFDPCPLDPEWEIDGLTSVWPNQRVFINPPYSNPKPWVKRAIDHPKTVVLLLKHDTSTEWYRMLHEAGAKFLLVNGRLKHGSGVGCAFPSVLAVLE